MAVNGYQQEQPGLRLVLWGLALFCFYKCLDASSNGLDEIFLCRHCGREIAHAKDIVKIASSESIQQRNSTVLGVPHVLIQLFENPYGRKFEVITTKQADVYKADKSEVTHTFFPGFGWRISVCFHCGFHLGWFFQPIGQNTDKKDSSESFYSLILANLLHKSYADSLLISPKFHDS